MKKKGRVSLGAIISKLVLKGLNMDDEEEQRSSEKPSDLLDELYQDMVDAKDSVTYSMAMVAMKRKKLREMLEKQGTKREQAKHFASQGNDDMAKRLLRQVIAMDEKIKTASSELEAIDAQAKAEIVHYRELEQKVEEYKTKIKAAEQMDRFNRIREKIGNTVNEFDNSVLSKIDRKLEKIEMKSAKLAANFALDAEKMDDMMLESDARQLLENEKLDQEFALLRAEVESGGDQGDDSEGTILLTESPADQARKLLDKPAFDGLLAPKQR